jgi:hypothetical protein
MDWVYGSRDHGSLSVHDGLTTMEWCDRSEARNVLVIAQSKRERERERRLSRFSLMVSLGGRVA